MGEFFTNIQVLRGTSGASIDREEIISRLVTALAAEGFHEVSSPGDGSRRIYVGSASADEWMTVLDSAAEGQDPARLDHVAGMLSRAAETAAIGVLVHDGDRLQLALFREGSKLASLDSWPGYFEGEPPVSTGDFKEWAKALPAGRSVDDLRQAWKPAGTVEGALPRLIRVARVLGMDPEQVVLGADSRPPGMEPAFTELIFARERPASEDAVAGLPVFGHEGGLKDITGLRIEERLRSTLIAHNTGGRGTGMEVMVWGSALGSGLVRISGCTLTVGSEGEAVEIGLEERPTSEGTALMAAAGLEVPAGYASPAEAFAAADGDPVLGMALWTAGRIRLDLDLVGVKPGTADLHACLRPVDNPDGEAIWTTSVRIKAPE